MNNKTLLKLLEELQESGYTEEIRLHRKDLHLHAISKDLVLEAKDFMIDKAYRFEGSRSDEDVSEMYAISSFNYGVKGILIDALDEYRSLPDHHPITDMLREAEKTLRTYDDSDQELKYSLP